MDVVDVQKQGASGPTRHFCDEVHFRIAAFGEGEIGRGVLEQHLPAERLLNLIDMPCHAAESLTGVGNRQQIVQEAGLVRRPGEMFRE